ncbi:four-carbon acid sugar kinase family protein [Deferribacterales bacterium RsTz2092]|nr:hypothetical protein AGMMS49941_05790 [Deferribacterales bacterium]
MVHCVQCIVIADDLTGANATGVLLKKINYTTYTILNVAHIDGNNMPDCDCIVYSTDSRAIGADVAYSRVVEAVKLFKSNQVKVYSKRIDTTLRGNLGSETDAMLDTLGGNRVAMIVPCFPSGGRILVGGYLLVNAIPLHKTEVAVDPKTPVHTPVCADLFAKQTKYPIGSIEISDIMQGRRHIMAIIKDFASRGVRNIVFDAVTQEDIDTIADAVIASEVPFIAVDPGVFTATLARLLMPVPQVERDKPKILVTVGSVNAIARGQVEHFLASQRVLNVFIEVVEFLEGAERSEAEISRVVSEVLNNCDKYELCSVVGRGIMPDGRVGLDEYAERYKCSADEISSMINVAIAEITYRIAKSDKNFKGFYTCGGDITVAVCNRMKTFGFNLLGEVLPMAAYGEMIGGDFPGLKFATKGGMVGDSSALVECVRYLRQQLSV